ncbi:hypothetical protein [Winogradskyella aquimaris]|uniref:Outer membrane protein beta-barrel domain-containing protein n=1 Tax=Winogradskyella aquimaris TaxID=864074 RepID=A0ABU5EM32_9FLAO|nr:hypothetical protein [Winogradskyella aquimaris]MDY2585824.1 hypothetical protein [Winogradskyella aquimaris]
MKKIIITILCCLAFQLNFSQETYTVNGESLELKTEIDGDLDLLWNVIDGQFRYFVRTKDGTLTELKNTKDEDKNYKEEYKSTLRNLTNGMATDKLKLTLYSLRNYLDAYNASVDSSYTSTTTESNVQFRLGLSGGLTNNPFVGNPDNIKTPMIGAELEIYEANVLPRHSGFLQARYTFENDDFKYSTTELSLGYRFRFINKESFSIYGQVKLATLNFSNVTFLNQDNLEVNSNETAFDIPFIFGIGSDIKVGNNSYITIIYGELFALLLDNQGNFSTDIAVGYKFNL